MTTLRKRVGDATLAFTFSDASVSNPKSGKGVVLSAEKPLGVGVRAAVQHGVASGDTTASLSVNKSIRGNDVQLRAVYRKKGNVFVLEETWRVDPRNRLSGSYNFSTEEAVVTFAHDQGPWTATAGYNLKREAPVLGLSRKQGKNVLGAVYAVKNDELTLQWARKPVRATVRASGVSKGQIDGLSANLLITHEFLI